MSLDKQEPKTRVVEGNFQYRDPLVTTKVKREVAKSVGIIIIRQRAG